MKIDLFNMLSKLQISQSMKLMRFQGDYFAHVNLTVLTVSGDRTDQTPVVTLVPVNYGNFASLWLPRQGVTLSNGVNLLTY